MSTIEFDIITDGRSVWVNGETSLLGRFGVMGIDIHRPIEEQTTKGECLFCTHAQTKAEDWDVFVAKMKEHFDIDISDEYKPARFREKISATYLKKRLKTLVEMRASLHRTMDEMKRACSHTYDNGVSSLGPVSPDCERQCEVCLRWVDV